MKAKGYRILTILLATVMLLALSLNVMAAKSNAATKDGLTAQLFTDKDSYKTGEVVKASVQVNNNTGTDILIYAKIKVPDGLMLSNENTAFDAIIKNGESWSTPGGMLLTPAGTVDRSPSTGDNTQVGIWLVLVVLAVCGIFALFVYGKNRTTWVSMLLCMTMISGLMVTPVPVQAANINGEIPLSCTIQVGGKDEEVSATVSYVTYVETEVEDNAGAPSTEPSVTPDPTPDPTPEPTPSPTPEPTPEEVLESLFETDFEHETVGSKPGTGSKVDQWTKITEATKKMVRIEAENDNKMLHIYVEPDGASGGPRADRDIVSIDRDNMIVEFKVKTTDATAFIQQKSSSTQTLWSGQSDEWINIKLVMDLVENTYVTYINDVPNGEVGTLDIAEGTASIQFRFHGGTLQPGTGVYFDDIKISSTVMVEADQILTPNNTVNWDNVKPTEALSDGSYVNNLVSHPRIFVSEWEEIVEKISATTEATKWYANLKQAADGYLAPGAPERVVNSRGNVLESAREGRDHLQALAFVYKVEKQKGNTDADKYLEEAYAEMIEMGEWEDWSGFVSYLVTAELMFGYACAYDWLYDELTEVQRAEIIDIVKEQSLTALVYNYEGVVTSTPFTYHHNNWNPLCNGSAISAAFAFADEEPEIAEYILERGPGYILNCLEPYAPEGAYPEGVSYWDLGTTYLIFATDMLENGFVEGFEIPAEYKYYNAPGIAATCDFPIYYTGPAGRFNYGDCGTGMSSSVAFYWMANKFNKPQYAWYENKVQRETSYLTGYDAIAAICFYDPANAEVNPDFFELDKFYQADQDVNGISMRSTWEGDALYVAMQGGNNKENHQHLSLGTYVIDYHGKRFVKVLKDYDYALSGSKNEIYYKRAEAYNTLVINPSLAAEQELQGYANLIESGTSDNTAFGILDMSTAYTAGEATIISALRGMMLTDNRSRLIVQDEVKLDKASEFYWYANTDASIKITHDKKSAILNLNGDRMLARIIEGPDSAVFEVVEAKSTIEGVNNAVCGEQKLAIHVTGVSELNLAVEYIGLEDGEGIPAAGTYVPLADWAANDNDIESSEGLDITVKVDGEVLNFFEVDRENYVLDLETGSNIPTVSVEAIGASTNVTQATIIGTYGTITEDNDNDGIADDTAVVTVTKDNKTYTYYIRMQKDPFEGILSITDPGVLNTLKATLGDTTLPSEYTYIYVEDLEDSTGWATYPERGIVDGVINAEIANRWASDATECWIMMDFGETHNLHSMAFAGVTQESRQYLFDVQVSADGINWTTVHADGAPMTTDIMSVLELYDNATAEQKEALSNVRYVKMLGHGHIRTNGGKYAWNTWAEVRFYENDVQEQQDISYWPVYFASGDFEGRAGEALRINLKGNDYYYTEFDLRPDAVITYQIEDTSIAKVINEGGVDKLAFLSNGTTTMTITATQDGFTASTTVNIICSGDIDTTKYTVSFVDHNEASIVGDAYNYELTKNSVITVPEGPERASDATNSYTFIGWTLKGAGEGYELKQKGDEISVTGNATYVAVYEATARVYTAKYTLEDGTEIQTLKCSLNDEITLPENLDMIDTQNETYTQYNFTKWTVGETTKNPGDKVTVAEDVTYVAKSTDYSVVVNTLLFVRNFDESDEEAEETLRKYESVKKVESASKNQYVYPSVEDASSTESNKVLRIYAGENHSATATPIYLEKKLDLEAVSELVITFRVKTTGSANAYVRFRDNNSNRTTMWNKSGLNDWTKVKIDVRKDETTGKWQAYVDGAAAGAAFDITNTNTGLRFNGGVSAFGDNIYFDDLMIYVPAQVEEPSVEQVSINFVDDTDNSISGYPQEVDVNTQITMPVGVAKEADDTYTYEFAGWKVYVAGVVTGENIAAGTEVTVTESVTYKATYIATEKGPEVQKYTIIFQNLGTEVKSEQVIAGELITTPGNPTHTDVEVDAYRYEFVGWKDLDGVFWTEGTTAMSDTTYVAVYNKVLFERNFDEVGDDANASLRAYSLASKVESASANKYVYIEAAKEADKDNNLLHIYAGENHNTSTQTPLYLQKSMDLSNVNELIIEFKAKTTGEANAFVRFRDGSNNRTTMWNQSELTDWTEVKIVVVKETNGKWQAYIDGVAAGAAFDITNVSNVGLRFNGGVKVNGDNIYYDNIKIYTSTTN